MLEIRNVAKVYGTGDTATTALRDITLDVASGEFVSVVGPSGCGKTTLLKILAGLLTPTSGSVTLDGVPVTEPPEGMALVFQDYSRSLFPWMRVGENIAFPLKRRHMTPAARGEAVRTALRAVDLEGMEEKYPWQLSGGMQQRVSIARGLAYQPRILLMDEPFGALDAQTRQDLEDTLLRVRSDYDVTIVFVTHDIDESVYLGDRVVVLSPRPTVVSADLPVDLPPARDQVTTKEAPEFIGLRARVYTMIREGRSAAQHVSSGS